MFRLAALFLAYLAMGRLGIFLSSIPPGHLALFWLPSGIGAAMVLLHGRRALPLVFLASALVNGPEMLADAGQRPSAYALLPLVAAADALQSWLVGHFLSGRWRLPRRWTRTFLLAFLLRGVAAPALLTGWAFVALPALTGALHPPAGANPADFLAGRAILITLADALGIFLVVPLLGLPLGLALRRPARTLARLWPALLLPLPLALGSFNRLLPFVAMPLLAAAVAEAGMAGAAVGNLIFSLGFMGLVVGGAGEALGMDSVQAWAGIATIGLCAGIPALLLGVTLDELRESQNSLERRVDEKTQALREALAEMERLATTDRLTGSRNRRWFEDLASAEMALATRQGEPMSLLLLDIDHFKRVNDTLGHRAGDVVLAGVVERVRTTLRASDVVARWGGEEFVVLTPSTGRVGAAVLAEKIRLEVAGREFPGVGRITVSLGVAELAPGQTLHEWVARADRALYAAKHAGRNRVEVDTGADEGPRVPLMQLTWDEAYACGDPIIDRGHQRLFVEANRLLDTLVQGSDRTVVGERMDALITEVALHFEEEMAVLRAVGYDACEGHGALHQHLLARAAHLRERYLAGDLEITEVFHFLAFDVVLNHMLGADAKFRPWVGEGTSRPVPPG